MNGHRPPDHPITSIASVARFYFLLIRHPRLGRIFLRLLKTIHRTYFAPQFRSRSKRKIIPIDVALDATVPFDPTWLACYLGFVRLWIGSLGWLHRRFGDDALPHIESFLVTLESLFLEAYKVFSVCDSTVASRPGPRLSYNSIVIHLADRNSFCFPSLHVMIVRFNTLRMAAILDRLDASGQNFSSEKEFLHARSLRIVESIIHVKQHGLSDIPAGLFLLRHYLLHQEGMGPTHARDLEFINELFAAEDPVRAAPIRAFMKALSHAFENRGYPASDPAVVLVDFLKRYDFEIAALVS